MVGWARGPLAGGSGRHLRGPGPGGCRRGRQLPCPQIPVNAVSTPSLPNGLELQRLLESVGMVQYEGFFQALPSEDWRVLSAEPLEGC
jgi:hypothetical protein